MGAAQEEGSRCERARSRRACASPPTAGGSGERRSSPPTLISTTSGASTTWSATWAARSRPGSTRAVSTTSGRQLVGLGLSPRSVNMVLDLLAQILDDAVEYGLLDANPARGRRRRMKVPKSSRTFLEPDLVVDVLDAAGAWERELPEHQRYGRRRVPCHALPIGSANQRAHRDSPRAPRSPLGTDRARQEDRSRHRPDA